MWAKMDAGFAMKTYHWFFLAQPAPMPETLIARAPVEWLEHTLASWTKAKDLSAFGKAALAHYDSTQDPMPTLTDRPGARSTEAGPSPSPNDERLARRADALKATGDLKGALAAYDTAIRANPNDPMTLPSGETLPRGQAIRKLKGSPVPAWAFVTPEGREILMRRGSRTKVDAFMKFDQYVTSGVWPQTTFEEYLVQRGLREDKVE